MSALFQYINNNIERKKNRPDHEPKRRKQKPPTFNGFLSRPERIEVYKWMKETHESGVKMWDVYNMASEKLGFKSVNQVFVGYKLWRKHCEDNHKK